MWTELFFAINGGVSQIRREGDNHKVIFNSKGSRVTSVPTWRKTLRAGKNDRYFDFE